MNTLELNIATNGQPKSNAIIYITLDSGSPQANTLAITIKNTSDDSVTLTSQSVFTILPPNAASPNTLFDGEQFQDVSVEDGWSIAPIQGQFPGWTVSPAQDITLDSNDKTVVTLSNIETTNTNLNGQKYYWTFSWSIDGKSSQSIQRYIFVYNPPTPGLLPLELQHNFSQSGVAVQINESGTYLQNIPNLDTSGSVAFITQDGTSELLTQLTVYLTNTGTSSVTFNDKTQFIFSFVESDKASTDLGALASHDILKDITIQCLDSTGKTTSLVQQEQPDSIQWIYYPGAITLDTYSAATLQFTISHVYTSLPPYLTLLYIQYKNIKKYLDGVYSFTFQKVLPPPLFASLSVNGQALSLGEMSTANFALRASVPLDIGLNQPATLCWQTIGVDAVEVSPDHQESSPGLINGSYTFTPYPTATPDGGGNITLYASYQDGDPATIPLHFNLKPYSISEFEASVAGGARSAVIAIDDYGTPVNLYWKTQYVATLTITDDTGAVVVSYSSATDTAQINSGTTQVFVTRVQTTYTLTCTGYVQPSSPAPTASPIIVNAPEPVYDVLFTTQPSLVFAWDIPFPFDKITAALAWTEYGVNIPATAITPLPGKMGNYSYAVPGGGDVPSMVFTFDIYYQNVLQSSLVKSPVATTPPTQSLRSAGDPPVAVMDIYWCPTSSVTVSWEIPFSFDRVTVACQVTVANYPVCDIPATDITPLPPQVGSLSLPQAGLNILGVNATIVFYRQGQVLCSLVKNFSPSSAT